MRIVLIYRKPQRGGYSIEELFHAIAGEFRKQVDTIEYEVRDGGRFFLDIWRLWRLKADIYHVTGGMNYIVMLLPNKKSIITIHDIGNYLYGLTGIKRSLYKWLWLIYPMRSAKAVTSVSEKTRDDIVKHLGVEKRKIEIIENCHSAIFKPVSKPFLNDYPVILQVGTKPYKNVPRLIEALNDIRCRLVLIGEINDEIQRKLNEYQVDYENHTDLSHENIYQQYLRCDLVSFVSLGEGFGVPIVEAQAVGRPVITANIPPMSDVAGEGACLVNPLDVSEIRKGLQKIIFDVNYRTQLIAGGLRNVARYSPAVVSDRYLNLYRRLASV